MDQIIMTIIDWLSQFSYLGVTLALCIEFIPAEIVLPLAGFWVFEGKMNYYLVVFAGTVGGTLGPLTLYTLGRYGGRPFLVRYGKYLFIKEEHLTKSDEFFSKHGNIVAFSGRFMPVVRTVISIPCGISKMNVFKFAGYTFVAMLPITAFYVYLGFQFGANFEYIEQYAKTYITPIGLAIVLCAICYIFFKNKSNLTNKSY